MKTWQNHKETNLPVDLMVWVIRDGIIRPKALRTFLYLKLSYPDRFVLKPQLYTEISDGLKISSKTARTHINELIRANFIGVDRTTKMIFIRSIYKIVPPPFRMTRYHVKVSRQHLDHFTEFILAASFAFIVRKLSLTAKYRRALLNGGAFQSRYEAVSNRLPGYSVALSYIAKFLGKTISWVDKFKKAAKRLRWISVQKGYLSTDVKWDDKADFLARCQIPSWFLENYRGWLNIKYPDVIHSSINIRKGKKSVTI